MLCPLEAELHYVKAAHTDVRLTWNRAAQIRTQLNEVP